MNNLISQLKLLGADDRNSVLAAQVFLEICEVKRYWSPAYEFNQTLQKIIIRAKKHRSEPESVFLPIPYYEELTFTKIQHILQNISTNSIFLVIVHPDSTCVYYKISNDLEEPEPLEQVANHLRIDKQKQRDAVIRKNRTLIEHAALLNIPITINIPKEN